MNRPDVHATTNPVIIKVRDGDGVITDARMSRWGSTCACMTFEASSNDRRFTQPQASYTKKLGNQISTQVCLVSLAHRKKAGIERDTHRTITYFFT